MYFSIEASIVTGLQSVVVSVRPGLGGGEDGGSVGGTGVGGGGGVRTDMDTYN